MEIRRRLSPLDAHIVNGEKSDRALKAMLGRWQEQQVRGPPSSSRLHRPARRRMLLEMPQRS